ncbi:hypothetical protein DIURU_004087 [Diutina rugosa]|uniref:Threonyl/alanyl tRNA synthetase SAD domain-containing protein n=1 Tax=Diutina rugosa TaxID=5481 RepID=A0A642UIT4_DIURU|nr:uncharacterized protein DIURU_004087 [Diutina rugosa]KAA8899830.1 hypothetical protein DIURU_004087 [Diutina rugosa]
MSAIVGGLACQRDSFLRSLKTTVTASTKYPLSKTTSGYAVELKDTVLFPEGGGQPCDHGTLTMSPNKTVAVDSVIRDKLKALHITKEPLDVGAEVVVAVNWRRRLDIMQQHTGQHLLSAVLDKHQLPTLSWSMGDTINYLEVERPLDDALVAKVSDEVNQAIFDALPIRVVTGDELDNVDTSKVPDDYDQAEGIIRVVTIGDLDANPCCGTHLANTSQIQSVALLHQTNVRGGHSRLHFVCGGRVASCLRDEHTTLKAVGAELSAPLDGLHDKAVQTNQLLKKSVARESALLKELAANEATRILATLATADAVYTYRADNDGQFFQALQRELTTHAKSHAFQLAEKTVVMINGEYANGLGGQVKIMGPRCEELAAKMKQTLSNIKGGGKGANFQGKIPKYLKGELEATLAWLQHL